MSADATRATPPQQHKGWLGLGAGLLLLACLTRVVNALRYRTASGFDAAENVEYIGLLTHSWALPAPDAAWSTSHPPLFYYLGAVTAKGLDLVGLGQQLLQALPLMASAASIATALLAALLVLELDPGNHRRAVIASGLLLFLPVHIYTSAMVNEETLAALLVSLALLGGIRHGRAMAGEAGRGGSASVAAAAALGAVAGLAILTKLSGCLVAAAIAGAWLLGGHLRGEGRRVLVHVAAFAALTALVGGWFYARNLLVYGYLYPQDLSLHAVMFEMPPGQRGVLDYLRIPLATWTDPQLLNPDLLHSVWGSTYATIYFEAHRHFLPSSIAATRMGGLLLLLGVVPVVAFVLGLRRGVLRALHDRSVADSLMLALVALTLAGYVAFTWGNPWFATLKGGYLLGLSLPFAVYASEVLGDWTLLRGVRGGMAWGILALLVAAASLTFTIGVLFTKLDGPGLPWRAISGAG